MSIKEMKRAIEAWDACGRYPDSTSDIERLDVAINALRTAIQQAESEPVGEPRARVELVKTGGNAGLSTRIIELDIATRERLRPGDLLYTHPAPGVPVGQAPSVWNSIQIASWIGTQLMHEPSMFERATVCKFVRSLGRHPTLLKHSPKIHHAPGVPDALKDHQIAAMVNTLRDIARQFHGHDSLRERIANVLVPALKAEAQQPAPGVPDDVVRGAISTVREQYRGTDWGKAAECICDAIDAAMLATAQAQKGGE